jgi:hypothetical protein
MKKFAAFMMIVAVCAFSVGCTKTDKTKSPAGKTAAEKTKT